MIKNERDIINHLADKYKMSDAKILNIVSFQDRFITENMSNLTPRILIHNWGSYNLSIYKIEKRIKKLIQFKRHKPELYDVCKKEITLLWDARKRLKKKKR